jgi:hypothetical protein
MPSDHFTETSSSMFGSVWIVTSLYSSNNPALCICQAIGPVLPAAGSLKSKTSTALLGQRIDRRAMHRQPSEAAVESADLP